MIQAGHLRHQIVVETPTETADTMGGITTTWATFKTIRAAVMPLRGREYLEARQTQTAVSHRIRIRYLEDLTTKMRIKWGTRYFDIESVLNILERNHQMDLMVIETTPVKDG